MFQIPQALRVQPQLPPSAARPEWLPADFCEQPGTIELPLVSLCNLGCYTTTEEKVSRIYCAPHISPIQTLAFIDSQSGAGFYTVEGLTEQVVIKPEVVVYPKIGKIGREPSNLRHIIPVLVHLQDKGLECERPLLWLSNESGACFYGVERIEGKSLREALPSLRADELLEAAYTCGTCLANWHSAGVLHGHPHDANFFLRAAGEVLLIDAKAVTVKDEYPHTFRATKRTLSWEEALRCDATYAMMNFSTLSSGAGKTF